MNERKKRAERIGVRAQFDAAGRDIRLWKLQRINPTTKKLEIHPTAGGLGPTWMGTEANAKATAGQYPGWTLARA